MESKWIAHGKENNDARVNLLCFPYPGGSANSFAKWKNKFNYNFNICPILYPMRERRRNEKMHESVEKLVEDLVISNKELFHKDFAIFGYCAGAAIGYEVAVKVKKLFGKEPIYFMAASAELPNYAKKLPISYEADEKEEVIKYLKSLGGYDEEILKSDTFQKYYLPIVIADSKLFRNYIPSKPEDFNFDIDAVFGTKDKSISTHKIKEWDKVSSGKFEMIEYDAGHYFVDEYLDCICNRIMKKTI
ncbi:thioesterase II family protein [Clostridium paraputrificum]|uniref:thioesterase II family protein n=1 Tax=Clostridium paraputrificum TaxID=29363 RepID=UPI003D344A85